MKTTNRVDVMVDIETLGQGLDATVFQIAGVAFDIKTGEEYSTFNMVADIEIGTINVDGGTLKWWLKTDRDLLHKLLEEHSGVSPREMLVNFYAWLNDLTEDNRDLYLWGNGILFDNNILRHQIEGEVLKYPVFYRNDRDVCTILELASVKEGKSQWEIINRHVDDDSDVHDALNDARLQVRYVVDCYNTLVGK